MVLSILEKQLQIPPGTFTSIHKLTQTSGDFVRILNYPSPKDGKPLADPPTPLLTYFPASALPVDAGARFAELFLARPRWRGEEVAPFLADISVDAKERDKLLLKHARAVTDADGIWYTARAKYGG